MNGRVLIIAGSDPSGGAGIQADIKTVTAMGGYAAAAITALTVQNTMGVKSVHPIEPSIIRDQIIAVLEDIGADAVKIGMIGGVEAGAAILDALAHAPDVPIVLDPVLVATSGDSLSAEGLAGFIAKKMLPRCFIVTPNRPEAQALTGLTIGDARAQRRAGEALCAMGAKAALVKGGHMSGADVADYLAAGEKSRIFSNPRIETTSTHGTGCTLASAIAAGLAQGASVEAAVENAIEFVRKALASAPGFGRGAGPLNHGHAIPGAR